MIPTCIDIKQAHTRLVEVIQTYYIKKYTFLLAKLLLHCKYIFANNKADLVHVANQISNPIFT